MVAPQDLPSLLTARELDVLELLARGLSNAETAAHLFVEQTTIEYHLTGLLQKTASRDRLQAVLWGIRNGAITVGPSSSAACWTCGRTTHRWSGSSSTTVADAGSCTGPTASASTAADPYPKRSVHRLSTVGSSSGHL